MKVSVYKAIEGEMTVLVQASPGMGKAPVVVGGISRGNLKDKVLPVVEQMRGRRQPGQPLPGSE